MVIDSSIALVQVGSPLHKMLRHHRFLHLPAILAALLLTTTSAAADSGNPSGSSVNVINALNDSCVLHCSSKDTDFGQVAVFPKSNYYWKFDPNIFGRTVYTCEFLWGNMRQEFPVWEGSYYEDRPKCCSRGPCAYKLSMDGIYYGLTTDTDDNGTAESWEFYKPWVPNPIPSEA